MHAAPSGGGDYRERLLAARVNSVDYDRADLMLQAPGGGILVPADALAQWGIVKPNDLEGVAHAKQSYYRLDDLSNLDYSVNTAEQRLVIDSAPSNLEGTVVDAQPRAFKQPQQGPPGGFFNYDLLYQGNDAGRQFANATFETGLFNDWGVGTTRFLASGLDGNDEFVRLDSTWRYDWPEKLETLRLGDTFSRPGAWGRTVHFGGIQWGTNFGTQPDFVTFPLPTITGQATVPSQVQIYANGLRRARQNVDAGPFSVRDVPVTTGANNLRVVVQDVQGRERVITQPFFASQDLLKKGLQDYGYSAGFIRRNFSLRSNDYGDAFFSGTHRLGLTDAITGEARVEAQQDLQTAGLSTVTSIVPGLGIISGSAVGSTSDAGSGWLASIGLDRPGRGYSYSLQTTWTSPDFRQLGLRKNRLPPKRSSLARLSVQLFNDSSASVSYVSLAQREGRDSRFINANYSVGLSEDAGFSVFATRDLEQQATSIGITLTAALGGRTSASVSHLHGPGSERNRIGIQRSLPRGNGLGYRVSAENGDTTDNRGRLELAARSPYGSYRGEVAQTGADTAYRVNARGGAAFLAGNFFVSRQVRDSFGVVEVGDYGGVDIYDDNQKIAQTNANGAAFLPDLRAFGTNRLSFEQKQLPLGVQVADQQITAVPGYRHGALVDFDVSTGQGALIRILRPNGDPVPAGATVSLVDQDTRFPVARRGEAWVTGLADRNRLQARWADHRCRFAVALPEDPGPSPRLGPVVCRAIR